MATKMFPSLARACLCPAVLLVAPPVAEAAERGAAVVADASVPAGSIVVTGQPLAAAPAAPAYDTQVIPRERITSSASGRIEDVLSAVAGFQQFRRSDSRSANPSAQGVTLRSLGGNATSRSLVLLDGVPMADPFFGYVTLSAIDPGTLARVRVTRGGGAGAFGAGAVAGTIELESAGPGETGLLRGEALIDDRGETTLSGSLAPRLGAGFAVLTGRWDHGRGFWTTPASQRVPASSRARYRSWSTGLRGVAAIAPDIELQARGLVFDDHRTLRFAGANSSSSGADAGLRLVGRGRWQFDVLGYVQTRDFSNVVISATSFRKTLDQRKTPSTGRGGKVEVRPPIGTRQVLRLGTDWRSASGTMHENAVSGATGLVTARRRASGTNADVGFYAEHDWRLGALTLTAGARADRWSIRDGRFREVTAAGLVTRDDSYPDRNGWTASFRGGTIVDLGHGLALRGSAYSGLRQPTLNELYRSFTVFPVITRANAALANERLEGFEAGVDFAPSDPFRFSLTAFDNRVRHAVANVTIGPNLRERRNVGAVHARGLELGASARSGAWGLDGSLALSDAEVEASGTSAALDGLRPAQTPKIAGSATLSWRPRGGLLVAASVKHVGRQFEDDLETDSLPAATTIDAFAEVPVGRGISLVLRGENLTATRVITRNQAGSLDLGAPRTIWAGFRLGGD